MHSTTAMAPERHPEPAQAPDCGAARHCPETFSRVLRSLREHGLILGTGNVLKLPQPGALEMVASGS